MIRRLEKQKCEKSEQKKSTHVFILTAAWNWRYKLKIESYETSTITPKTKEDAFFGLILNSVAGLRNEFTNDAFQLERYHGDCVKNND